jgi:peptidyl-prolyl cis-trans isomerase SurA
VQLNDDLIMNLKFNIYLFFLCFTGISFSQVKDNDVLFTVDNDPILASEFIRIYNKNLDLVKDESQKDINAYLELFVNYQLKIKEAKRLELDKDPKYLREFENYKAQLTKNFLSESKVTDALVNEAYQRLSQDIKASHILIMINENTNDTLEVYNRLLKLRQRVIAEGFEAVQKDVHDGTAIFAEDLGYFSAFKMVYEFENAAYNTKIGEVSLPFRTRFGYHIVKVYDKRPSRGEVTVAHIMVSNKQSDSTLIPEVRIKEIYKKIEQKEHFESLAKQFSDDKSSSDKGGLLAPFKGGQLTSQEFEDVAFGLKNSGEISKPFKTDFGWHIVKLINKKGLEPFEEVRGELETKVKRDSRSNLINSALVEKLKAKYSVKTFEGALAFFETIVNDDFFKNAWKLPEYLVANESVLTIAETKFLYSDFGNYLMAAQQRYSGKSGLLKEILKKELENYIRTTILKYHEEHLEFENKDFAYILQEYRDGLLLFDLMEQQVWNAAMKDTLGLKKYYEAHKDNYVWQNRVDAIVISSANIKDVTEAAKLLQKGLTADEINAKINSDKTQKIIITKGIMEQGHQGLPDDFEFKKGVSKIYNYNDSFHVFNVKQLMSKTYKTLDEAKGTIINDFQNDIEKNWVNSLKQQFKVVLNEDVLEKVKSQITK